MQACKHYGIMRKKVNKTLFFFVLVCFFAGSVFPQETVKGDWIVKMNTHLGRIKPRLSRDVY